MTKENYIKLLEDERYMLIAYAVFIESCIEVGDEPLDYSLFEGFFDIEGDKMKEILKDLDKRFDVKKIKEVTVDITITEQFKYI